MWYLDKNTGEVFEDDAEFTGLIATVDPDDNGNFSLGRDLPPVMRTTLTEEAQIGNSPNFGPRAFEILADWIESNWRYGRPDGFENSA